MDFSPEKTVQPLLNQTLQKSGNIVQLLNIFNVRKESNWKGPQVLTSHRFPIQSLWFTIAATPKEASEKLRSAMLRPVSKNAKSGDLCSMTLCQLKSLSNEGHFKSHIAGEKKYIERYFSCS